MPPRRHILQKELPKEHDIEKLLTILGWLHLKPDSTRQVPPKTKPLRLSYIRIFFITYTIFRTLIIKRKALKAVSSDFPINCDLKGSFLQEVHSDTPNT